MIKTCFMNHYFSCTVVPLRRWEWRRTVYWNMFNILKKLFMLEIFKKIKTIHINWAIQLTIIEILLGIYFQYSHKCSRSLNQVISTMSYQWINNKTLLEQIPLLIKWNITKSWRYCEHNYTRLTHESKL